LKKGKVKLIFFILLYFFKKVKKNVDFPKKVK